MSRRKILISGGGIAGLTAALCHAQQGDQVKVYERAESIQPLGAGIQISPNAFHVLKEIGLGRQLRALGDQPNAIIMMNALTGRPLNQLPLGMGMEDAYQAPYLVIHRADLQGLLLKACEKTPDIELFFSSEIKDAAPHDNGVTVLVRSDSEIQERVGDVLIGADGVHSHIRNSVLKFPKARYSGKTAWRALVPAAEVSDHQALQNTIAWLGPKAHAVTYPVRQKQFMNVIAVTQETASEGVSEILPGELSEKFRRWDQSFTDVFLNNDLQWTAWPLHGMGPPSILAARSIVLVGDAAHAMLPFAAQGAAQAIEDAHVLARCLGETEDIETALKTYQELRLPRVRKVVKTATSNGRIYHMTGPMAMARNLALKNLSGNRLLKKQDWIYRWRPDQ